MREFTGTNQLSFYELLLKEIQIARNFSSSQKSKIVPREQTLLGSGYKHGKNGFCSFVMPWYHISIHQQVFDKFLNDQIGYVDNKYLAAAIVAYRRGKEANLKAYPNVHRTLNHLMKSGIRLAIVSDAPSREAWMRIYYLNLHHMFDAVVTFDDSKERKPSPKPFNLVLEKLDLNKEDVVMIGDWPERDVVGANSLGIKTIFARYGDTFGVKDSGANWDIDDISELIDIVEAENEK